VVKDAVALLKQRNPHTKVLVAVGGATYTNWAQVGTVAVSEHVLFANRTGWARVSLLLRLGGQPVLSWQDLA
jgi:hypothetical protein